MRCEILTTQTVPKDSTRCGDFIIDVNIANKVSKKNQEIYHFQQRNVGNSVYITWTRTSYEVRLIFVTASLRASSTLFVLVNTPTLSKQRLFEVLIVDVN